MENLKEDYKLLYNIYLCNCRFNCIVEEINKCLELIEEKKKKVSEKKKEIDLKKKKFIKLKLLQKEKESLVDLKQIEIDKYLLELNKTKSNDTYKLILDRIDNMKNDKLNIEDELLEIMTVIDNETITLNKINEEFKIIENNNINDIDKIIKKKEKLDIEISKINEEKIKHKFGIKKNILEQYEKLEKIYNENVLSMIDGDSCCYCGILLRPQLINQLEKYSELVFCDSCCKILLLKNN
jgi:predicted  nucleic acid-binding Zn-ribbon protein